MENSINVAELLKDCPKGMELDFMLCDDVVFEELDFSSPKYPIVIKKLKTNMRIYLTKYGQYVAEEGYKCIIFPKGKTSWEGFVPPCKFKDGDIISDSLGTCIFKGEGTIKGTVDYYCGICSDYFNAKDHKQNPNAHFGNIVAFRFAFEEEKEKLFKAIKANGYKWNAEIKTLEKLPKFKVGDKIFNTLMNRLPCDICGEEILQITNNKYIFAYGGYIYIKDQDQWELVPDKFNINTLVPFESKVLVRNYTDALWSPAIFGCYVKDNPAPYFVLGGTCWTQCIPYEGNEHLQGKTDRCSEFYKTWKE